MKQFLLSALITAIFFVIFSSCNEHESAVSTTSTVTDKLQILPDSAKTLSKKKPKSWPTVIYDSVYGKITIDTNATIILPMAGQCGIKFQSGRATHHFEPKPGKVVGVWPYDYSVANLTMLKTKYGYSGIFATPGSYSLVRSIGIAKENILLDTSFPWTTQNYRDVIKSYDAGYYYIGEAVNHSCIGNDQRMYMDWELQNVKDTVHYYRPNSAFVSDGYKRCGHLTTLGTYVDKMMYPSYVHWYYINTGGCYTNMGWGLGIENPWIEGNYDQRPDWSEMRSLFGAKFSQTWIKTSEITEFNDLFGHAKNLGLNAVWVYGYRERDGSPAVHYNDQWYNIADGAFRQGFLRQFIQDIQIEWRCALPNPCDCNPADPEQWYIYQFSYLPGTIREIFP